MRMFIGNHVCALCFNCFWSWSCLSQLPARPGNVEHKDDSYISDLKEDEPGELVGKILLIIYTHICICIYVHAPMNANTRTISHTLMYWYCPLLSWLQYLCMHVFTQWYWLCWVATQQYMLHKMGSNSIYVCSWSGAMKNIMCKYTSLFVQLQLPTRPPAVNVRHRVDDYILDLEDDRAGESVWDTCIFQSNLMHSEPTQHTHTHTHIHTLTAHGRRWHVKHLSAPVFLECPCIITDEGNHRLPNV